MDSTASPKHLEDVGLSVMLFILLGNALEHCLVCFLNSESDPDPVFKEDCKQFESFAITAAVVGYLNQDDPPASMAASLRHMFSEPPIPHSTTASATLRSFQLYVLSFRKSLDSTSLRCCLNKATPQARTIIFLELVVPGGVWSSSPSGAIRLMYVNGPCVPLSAQAQ